MWCNQVDYGIIWQRDSMLPEYGICMALVRSTSAALSLCDSLSATYSDRSKSESDNKDSQCPTVSKQRLNLKDVVDILCYIWYFPLFFAGPLMTGDNFSVQVSF